MNDLLGDVRTESVMAKVNDIRLDANAAPPSQTLVAVPEKKPDPPKPTVSPPPVTRALAEPPAKKHYFTKYFRKHKDSSDSDHSSHANGKSPPTSAAPAVPAAEVALPTAPATMPAGEPGVEYYITDEQFLEQANKVKSMLQDIAKNRMAIEERWNAMSAMYKASELRAAYVSNEATVTAVKRSAKAAKETLTSLQGEIDIQEMDSSDRMRMTMVNGMMKHLKEEMDKFKLLEEKVSGEYAEVVARRLKVATGQAVDEDTVEKLIESGEAENIFRRAQQLQQSRGTAVAEVLQQTEDRYQGMLKLSQDLKDLDQMMLDFATLVAEQGAMVDNIAANLEVTAGSVQAGTSVLLNAKGHFKTKQKYKAAATGVAAGAAAVVAAGAAAVVAPLAM